LSFLLSADKRLSYGETHEAVARVAGTLVKMGVEPGDRVVVMLPNSVDYGVLTYAIFHAGAIAVMVNPRWTKYEVEGAVKLTRPKLIVETSNLAAVMAGKDARIERRKSPTGTALMLLTSGTTGKSKAVMLTQEALAA